MSSSETISVTLKVWRQKSAAAPGSFVDYALKDISTHMSFLEMLDVLNEKLAAKGFDPVAFDHDCREGICGSCALVINGNPHGPDRATTTCQLHMRRFRNGELIVVEPFRARAFPIVKDLVTDRSALDRVIEAGGFVSVGTGQAAEANAIPVPKHVAERAFEAAACIGCGACVAACPNAAAMLFVGAKITHLNLLPQGHAEKDDRVRRMVSAMDENAFGSCSNTGACEATCPKEITLETLALMNRQYALAVFRERPAPTAVGGSG